MGVGVCVRACVLKHSICSAEICLSTRISGAGIKMTHMPVQLVDVVSIAPFSVCTWVCTWALRAPMTVLLFA